ncbi:hypothetical protein LSH36_404g01019 [Paralvinella palmiformis]|uniref:EGF-like domain-containing protein n=1 Tax=Paralvinella palmiformis TaxID=53620 RepID=A0AAD9JCB3_9ANNE|nr:hypothetical protein LSH36_404g01019 [Paralvinella palmiformis]
MFEGFCLGVIVLSLYIYRTSSSYARTLECAEDEVKIISPWMYEENGPPCYEFITSYPNLKNEAFRKECQRWYGSSETPYTLGNYQVFYCRRHANGTTQYRADICCKVHFRKKYPFTERTKDNACADKTTCEALAFTNEMLCKSWIPNPKCVYCCDTAFCNLETPSPMHHPCDDRPCKNGGMCINQGSSFKCICKQGFTGLDCSIEVIQCKYTTSLWKNTYSMFLDFGSDDCTEMLAVQTALPIDDPRKLKQCRSRMRQPGKPEFQDSIDGEVKKLEARFLWTCAKGENYGEYSEMICCPSCYSMPCQNGGWCIQQTDGDYICKCRFGWEETGLCLVTGDPHYITFDGTVFTTQTLCRLIANDVAVGVGAVVSGTKVSYNGRFLRLERGQVIIEFDGLWTLVIKLGSYYKEKVMGLCGNYDGDPVYSELYKRGSGQQKQTFETCVYDACVTSNDLTVMKDAICAALEAFALQCEGLGHYVDWRPTTKCPMVCPDGLVYRKKAAACRPSCQDPNAAKLCHLPDKETCVCPEGLLYHDGSCIRPQDCGCIDENSTRYEITLVLKVKYSAIIEQDALLPARIQTLQKFVTFHLRMDVFVQKIGTRWLSKDCLTHFSCDTCDSCLLPVAVLKQNEHRCDKDEVCVMLSDDEGQCQQEPDCPPGMEYQYNISSCLPSCKHPLDNPICDDILSSGCACEGTTWLSKDCSERLRCSPCNGNCLTVTPYVNRQDHVCNNDEICIPIDNNTGICQPVPECTNGMVYHPFASDCPATCTDPDAPVNCSSSPGCTCPEGLVLSEGKCVEPMKCGCETSTGKILQNQNARIEKYTASLVPPVPQLAQIQMLRVVVVKVPEEDVSEINWLSADCQIQYSCEKCATCRLPVGVLKQSSHKCPINNICVPDTSHTGNCRPAPTCPPGMVYNVSAPACAATCRDPNAPIRCSRPPTANCSCPYGTLLEGDHCLSPGQCKCITTSGKEFEECMWPVAVPEENPYSCPSGFQCVADTDNIGHCKPPCPDTMVFSFNATSCQPSCTDPDAPERCEKKPGCICPRGQVLEDDICINAIHCGCVDDSGRKIGSTWWSADCTIEYRCVLCQTCNLPVGQIVSSNASCEDDHICVQQDNYGMCEPGPACPDTMIFSRRARSCHNTCRDPTATERCTRMEGCMCPEGLLKDGTKCVKPTDCTCTYGKGHFNYSCTPCVDCPMPVPRLTNTQHQCAVCTSVDEDVGKCERVTPCPTNMIYRQNSTGCPATCQDPDAPQHCRLANKDDCVCVDGLVLSNTDCVTPDLLVRCPRDMEYAIDVTACPATCSDPDAPQMCTKPRTKRCTCKPGLVLRDFPTDECVKPRDCLCSYDGQKFEIGSTWLSADCSRRYLCKPCTECVLPVAKIMISAYQCDDGQSCDVDDTGLGQCIDDPSCPPSMIYSKIVTSCPATCHDPDAPQRCPEPPHVGCTCPDNMVYMNNRCMEPSRCPCKDEYGRTFQVGDTWLSYDCTIQYNCDRCSNCRLPVSVVQTRIFHCSDGQRCVSFDNKYGICKQGSKGQHVLPPAMTQPHRSTAIYRTTRVVTVKKIGMAWLSADCKKRYECKTCKTCTKAIAVIKESPYSCHSDEICDIDWQGLGMCIIKETETASADHEKEVSVMDEIGYMTEMPAGNPILTLNGIVIEPNSIIDVQPHIKYTLGITLSHSSSGSRILMRKVIGYSVTQHEQCLASRTCRDVYQFERSHEWQRVRLEIELLDEESSIEIIIVCNIKDPTEDAKWKITARSVSALSSSSSNMVTIKTNFSILVSTIAYLVLILPL